MFLDDLVETHGFHSRLRQGAPQQFQDGGLVLFLTCVDTNFVDTNFVDTNCVDIYQLCRY